ncbi:MAG: hypothetical protein GY841_17545 [FCB group bacterium]|nr:hypothetical protein [FCB group bacterium]
MSIKRAKEWLKLIIGMSMLAAMVLFFTSGYTPPGLCGEVVRHNQLADIDASPFFYGDVENIWELVEGAEKLRAEARKTAN